MLQGNHWSLEISEGAMGSGHQEAPLCGRAQMCALGALPSPQTTPAPGASSALASHGDPKPFSSVIVPACTHPARLHWRGRSRSSCQQENCRLNWWIATAKLLTNEFLRNACSLLSSSGKLSSPQEQLGCFWSFYLLDGPPIPITALALTGCFAPLRRS